MSEVMGKRPLAAGDGSVTDDAALALLREQVEITLEQAKAVRAGMDELVELLRRARRDLDRYLDDANRRAPDRY